MTENMAIGSLIWIFMGSALGGMMRFTLSNVLTRRFPGVLPWGTLAVNVGGSFLVGLLTVQIFSLEAPSTLPSMLLLVTGFGGGLTTFSTLIAQAVAGWERGNRWAGGGQIVLNLMLSLIAVATGFYLGDML